MLYLVAQLVLQLSVWSAKGICIDLYIDKFCVIDFFCLFYFYLFIYCLLRGWVAIFCIHG